MANTQPDNPVLHEVKRELRYLPPVSAWVIKIGALLVLISWLPLAIGFQGTTKPSPHPRVHFIQDMDRQPKYRTQSANPLFVDGRAMRPPVAGTVARGELRLDDHLYRGLAAEGQGVGEMGEKPGPWATTFPFEITESVMKRGQKQFGVHCSVCHGLDGGDRETGMVGGPVHVRAQLLNTPGWIQPSNLHTGDVPKRPLGHLYNSIANGIRTMPAYGPQIDVEDRWAIVAYVKALQLSQSATEEDVPAENR